MLGRESRKGLVLVKAVSVAVSAIVVIFVLNLTTGVVEGALGLEGDAGNKQDANGILKNVQDACQTQGNFTEEGQVEISGSREQGNNINVCGDESKSICHSDETIGSSECSISMVDCEGEITGRTTYQVEKDEGDGTVTVRCISEVE